ncbi:MAG TPA: hypothetical protein VJU14_10385 [Solirubrobacterales bacterium]|nr:hypothetical protein [Solirubrobacterales bacterium]
MKADRNSSFDPLPLLEAAEEGKSGSSTAKKAMAMLTSGDLTFRSPARSQRRNLAMAFAGLPNQSHGNSCFWKLGPGSIRSQHRDFQA